MVTEVYLTNILPLSSVIGSFPLINLSPFVLRLWTQALDLGHIFVKYTYVVAICGDSVLHCTNTLHSLILTAKVIIIIILKPYRVLTNTVHTVHPYNQESCYNVLKCLLQRLFSDVFSRKKLKWSALKM